VFVFCFFLFLFFLFLSLSFYLINEFGVSDLKKEKRLIKEKKSEIPDTEEKEEKMKEFNQVMSGMDSVYSEYNSVTPIFEDISDTLPVGCYLTSFRFDGSSVNLSGRASDWELLLEVEESFKEKFSNVDFSPGSWTQAENVDFLIKFEVK